MPPSLAPQGEYVSPREKASNPLVRKAAGLGGVAWEQGAPGFLERGSRPELPWDGVGVGEMEGTRGGGMGTGGVCRGWETWGRRGRGCDLGPLRRNLNEVRSAASQWPPEAWVGAWAAGPRTSL